MNMRGLVKKHAVLATVFITGACVLVIEVVATRILAPYFGNTIFTVSSVLSVVLAALSVGYYIGGKLADRYPTQQLFYGMVFAGGLGVFALYWLQIFLLPTLGNNLSLTVGPLITTILLFYIPSFILGMLSPFAIKLQELKAKNEGIGSISGSVFFYSTLGSIFGSLLAGYVLIPNVGVRATVIGVAVVLVALGLVPLMLLGMDKRFATKVCILVGLGVLLAMFSNPAVQAVYNKDGVYERITIVDGTFEGKPARFLFQDRSASAAMFLESDDLVYEYTKYYALYEIFTPEPKRALAIGGGAYSVPKALLKDLPELTVDASEIEPSLVDLGEKYFNVPSDPRLNHLIADGRRLLHDAKEPYDLIFSDVYQSLYSIPMHFTTEEFFQTAYDKLNDNGVFIANIIGSLDRRPPSLILAEVRTLQAVFPHVYLFAVESPDSKVPQNLMLVGHKSDQPITLDPEQLKNSQYEVIRNLAPRQVDLEAIDLSPYPKLTDDFAPVENWTAEMLRRRGT